MEVRIKFKDGTERVFPEQNRPGGSYSQSIKYEGVFVVVVGVYGETTSFPAERVAEVKTSSTSRGW